MVTFFRYFRIAALSALASYLALLAAAVFYAPVTDFFLAKPIEIMKHQRFVARLKTRDRVEGYHQPERDGKKGVVVFDPAKTYGDYTFFSSAWGPKLDLIDLKGNIVHEWTIDWQKIWADPKDWKFSDPPLHSIISRAFLQPDGSVIALFSGEGSIMGNYGMAKVDKDSKLIWKYNDFANHDISIMPDGRILVLVGEIRETPHPAVSFLKPPFIEPYLVTLSPDGREISRLSVFDMFANSPAKKFLWQMAKEMNPQPANGDIFHPNTITRVTDEAAARNPAFERGQYLLSIRNFNMLAVVDLDLGKITWASYGPWHRQHSPEFIADGSLVMFDNMGNLGNAPGLSRVLNVDPVTRKILWEYDGTDKDPVFSSVNGGVDPLPNGNVLVTETETGRLFEVTRGKEIVWDYRAPQRAVMGGKTRIPSLFSGKRFRREDLPFLNGEPPGRTP
jgi:hypothetical protein